MDFRPNQPTLEVLYEECRESQCPALPLELWERIIAKIDPQYHPRTWLNIRRVSHKLKAATEHVFATEHLPLSRIEFKPLVLRDETYHGDVYQANLSFERLSDDGTRAIFASKEGFDNLKAIQALGSYQVPGANETVYDLFMRNWRQLACCYTEPYPSVEDVCFPSHCFVMHQDVNDTELPGVEFDIEGVTVSIQWKPMLSIFYGEAEYQKWAYKVTKQHTPDIHHGMMDMALVLREAFANGSYMQVREQLSTVMDKAEKQEDEITSKIRVMRFKRILGKMEYRERGQHIPEEVFKAAGRALFVKSVRFAADWDPVDAEETHIGKEIGRGCFYDGTGLKFEGKGELNEPGVTSDDEDEWEDLDKEDWGDDSGPP
ncbi:hypothetical protein N0V82_002419 [Gnomoniopsis sp. IMI 355080]|nr:hypothetical protein N0V82_002419 [Gnomoniopsis sp. IMI 355080]